MLRNQENKIEEDDLIDVGVDLPQKVSILSKIISKTAFLTVCTAAVSTGYYYFKNEVDSVIVNMYNKYKNNDCVNLKKIDAEFAECFAKKEMLDHLQSSSSSATANFNQKIKECSNVKSNAVNAVIFEKGNYTSGHFNATDECIKQLHSLRTNTSESSLEYNNLKKEVDSCEKYIAETKMMLAGEDINFCLDN